MAKLDIYRRSFVAVSVKNGQLLKSSCGSVCCQIIVPICVLLFVGGIGLLFSRLITLDPDVTFNYGDINPGGNNLRDRPYYINWMYYQNSTDYAIGEATKEGIRTGNFYDFNQENLTTTACSEERIDECFFGDETNQEQCYFQLPEDTRNEINQGIKDLDTECPLSTCDLWERAYCVKSSRITPYFTLINDGNSIDSIMTEKKRDLSKIPAFDLEDYRDTNEYKDIFPSLFLNIKEMDASKFQLNMEVAEEVQEEYIQFSNVNLGLRYVQQIILDSFLNTIGRGVKGFMPQIVPPPQLDVAALLGSFLYPLAFTLLAPAYTYGIVFEKQEKLKDMMKMMGLDMSVYWTVSYVFNFVEYLIILILAYIVGAAFGLDFFTKTSFEVTFLLFVGWGLAQISWSFFFSNVFSKARTASLCSWALVILTYLTGLIVNSAVLGLEARSNLYFLYLYPPWAFIRGVYLIGTLCNEGRCISSLDGELGTIILFLFLMAIVYFLLAIYLEQILPSEYGVRKKFWFPLKPLFKLCRGSGNRETSKTLINEYNQNANIDEDILEEAEQIREGKFSSLDYPIVVKNLHKKFPGGKVAIVDLSLRIPQNECFGLLGPNGAGKTTTISCLTGLISPSLGTADVCGYDLKTEMNKIHNVLGVCPQFDVLYPTLTCRQTLMFYSRLKGLSTADSKAQTDKSLEDVGLTEAQHKQVKQLSGGMRRRLSVAVSLVGDPSVIFLDEPTTGLDPETRRQLWDVLLKVKAGRCIVLTTHSMEEADIICDKIGIMSQGTLRCLGSNLHLKNKYGSGYTLKISFHPENEKKARELINKVTPTAKETEYFPGNITFEVPTTDLVLSNLFENMTNLKDEYGILDYGISQTTLEDVFLNIVKNEGDAKDLAEH